MVALRPHLAYEKLSASHLPEGESSVTSDLVAVAAK
jgi:hypothetical protein